MSHDAICREIARGLSGGERLTPFQISVLLPLKWVPLAAIFAALRDMAARGEIESEGPIECGAEVWARGRA